jgi:endonuclease/exonuclease/phosphatase family metal-dependent hydrolase
MSQSTSRRATVVLLTALCATAALPAAASAKPGDLKVMTRNVYLGADIIPLAGATDEASFETAAAQRFETVQKNDFPARAKLLAAEIRKAKPDIVGVQEATTWRRGADGVKDGPATPATQVVYDSATELLKALKAAGAPYKEVVGRDWFDFEAPTALNYDVRITQRDVILVRKGSKVKLRKTFKGQFTNHFDPPTVRGPAPELRGWVGVDGTLAKKKFRFVSTHLEAYSPAIANQQMQQLISKSGPLGSKTRQSILVGDYNSAPGANANDRGTTRKDNAYDSAIKAGFRNTLPRRKTCCFAEDLHSTADKLETWIDHVLVRSSPKIKLVKSGIVGTKQVGGIYPSDHAGITATLRLK